MTESASKTNNPPIIKSTYSCLVAIETDPNKAPRDKDPVSPINIIAGGALNHKKPSPDPNKAQHNIANSPVLGI